MILQAVIKRTATWALAVVLSLCAVGAGEVVSDRALRNCQSFSIVQPWQAVRRVSPHAQSKLPYPFSESLQPSFHYETSPAGILWSPALYNRPPPFAL